MAHPDYPHLFSPLRIGNFEVPNGWNRVTAM